MNPSVECRKMAAFLREKAKMLQHDPKLKAEYDYLVRGFLRLAAQMEQDTQAKKAPDQRNRIRAA